MGVSFSVASRPSSSNVAAKTEPTGPSSRAAATSAAANERAGSRMGSLHQGYPRRIGGTGPEMKPRDPGARRGSALLFGGPRGDRGPRHALPLPALAAEFRLDQGPRARAVYLILAVAAPEPRRRPRADPIAARSLRRVERIVGQAQEALDVVAVHRPDRDASRHGDASERLLLGVRERHLRDQAADPLGRPERLLALDVGHHHQELFAAPARDELVLADVLA